MQRAVAGLAAAAPPGVLLAARHICPGDELALLACESRSVARGPVARQRASGAARLAARALLFGLGHADAPLPKDAFGAPVWPKGIVGSLAHDETIAIAGVANLQGFRSLGVDVEPAAPLPNDLTELVLTPRERTFAKLRPTFGRMVFCIKEAVHKCCYHADAVHLEFADICVDFDTLAAHTCHGRRVPFRASGGAILLAVAWIPN
jgi:4'-phosphopantetheinyl transferase EntD